MVLVLLAALVLTASLLPEKRPDNTLRPQGTNLASRMVAFAKFDAENHAITAWPRFFSGRSRAFGYSGL
ncbi:hypothetical protein DVQ80_22585 [Yersinia enterocolitica]|nr:hypothetical protein [Yersinia enterocolitica]